jgi:hypothetical protein
MTLFLTVCLWTAKIVSWSCIAFIGAIMGTVGLMVLFGGALGVPFLFALLCLLVVANM